MLSQVAQLVQTFAHHNPRATVLEISAGTGTWTGAILNALGGEDPGAPLTFSHYTFTDISTELLEEARKRFTAWGDLISYTELDIEQETQEQVARDGSIDLCYCISGPPQDQEHWSRFD